MKRIEYRIKSAKKKDIQSHLIECSEQFVPMLSSYVDIEEYTNKISKHAITFEAWFESKLISLVAVYYNSEIGLNCFITNVSIEKKYEGLGIAKNLLNLCMDIGKMKNFKQVDLKVNKANLKAIMFYEYLGFTNQPEEGLKDDLFMFYKL